MSALPIAVIFEARDFKETKNEPTRCFLRHGSMTGLSIAACRVWQRERQRHQVRASDASISNVPYRELWCTTLFDNDVTTNPVWGKDQGTGS